MNSKEASFLAGTLSPEEILRAAGVYYITGDIEEGSLVEISQDILLKHMNSEWNQDIMIVVNSCGGNLDEGWMLIDLLDYFRLDVVTLGLGTCASLGAMLVSSGTCGKRRLARRTTLMTHLPGHYGLGGNHHVLTNEMKVVQREYDKTINFWLEKSSLKTQAEVEKPIVSNQDTYLTPEEAIAYGIADEIITHKKGVQIEPKAKTPARPKKKIPPKKASRSKKTV